MLQKCQRFLSIQKAKADDSDSEEKNVNNEGKKSGILQNLNQNKSDDENKNKRIISLQANFVNYLFQLILIIIIMESYYITLYVYSKIYLSRSWSMTIDFNTINRKGAINMYIQNNLKELIHMNATTRIAGNLAIPYLTTYYGSLQVEEEELIQNITNNQKFYTNEVVAYFNKLYFSSICEMPEIQNDSSQYELCKNFDHGILKQGMHEANYKYFSYLQGLFKDFLSSDRSLSELIRIYNTKTTDYAVQFAFTFSLILHNRLVEIFRLNIDSFFSTILNVLLSLLISFIIVLLVILIYLNLVLIRQVQIELWQTKQILSIIPPEIIVGIGEIKSFLYKNSSSKNFN